VTVIERHAELPAASPARMTITFVPLKRGIGPVFQAGKPVAAPLPPTGVVQVTEVTPTLSAAFPDTTIEDAVVNTDVRVGEVSDSDGAVVSGAGAAGMSGVSG